MVDRKVGKKKLSWGGGSASSLSMTKTLQHVLQSAIRASASVVHLEPREEHTVVRFRVDGQLHQAGKLPPRAHEPLVTYIKTISALRSDEHRTPQSGSFRLSFDDKSYCFLAEIVPTSYGEKVAIKVLDASGKAPTLEQIGLTGDNLDKVNRALKMQRGLVLVTGMADSGKFTSLFSIVSQLDKPSINISSVESPIKHRIKNANQIEVNDKIGMTFASGLAAAMAQDSNVIVVSDIQDAKTAQLAIEAALTGKLVIAGIHAETAAAGVLHLAQLGGEPFLTASALRLAIGQKLVRTLCKKCRQSYTPTPHEVSGITRILGTTDTHKLWRASEKGCKECLGTGYKGRTAIFEVIANTPDVQRLITGKAPASLLQTQAAREGSPPMATDALAKATQGITSIQEVIAAASGRG